MSESAGFLDQSETPLLDPSSIPPTLYDGVADALTLPAALRRAYEKVLEDRGLLALAKNRPPRTSSTGGRSKEQSELHFAHAFDGSVARAQLAVLDPKSQVTRVSNAFLEALSGNSLCLVDVPCGAGAASLAFLACVAELRQSGVIPRMPLDVQLIGGEVSEHARELAAALFTELEPTLKRQAIVVRRTFMHWDVLNKLVNTDLIGCVLRNSQEPCKRLVVVANFNAFLEKERKRKEALPQLEELFRHSSGRGHVVVWLEPQMNTSVKAGGLLPAIVAAAKLLWRPFAKVQSSAEGGEILLADSAFRPAVAAGELAAVHLAVIRLDLERV